MTPAEDHEVADRQLLLYQDASLTRLHLKDIKPVQDLPGATKWIAAQSRYFLFALITYESAPRALAQSVPDSKHGKVSLSYPITSNTLRIPMKTYFGPKEINALHSVEPTLDLTVDFGWFTLIAYPILKVMKWLFSVFGNWGVAIILLTILIKILTFPLTYKSMKSMKNIAKLQPQMNALKEKHKDDKEALNREMITFMKTQGYNPVAGCLPMLIQMPVFFALYRVLYSSIELYQAPFMGWIHDLSVKDPFYITPILLVALMWLQQKITPSTATDPMQAKMLQYMPFFFGLMMISLPAGLTLYMLVNAAVSIIQQQYLNKKLA
jgi:YidC/Oxa1 family membrane protein insertase